jgi:hypothetical protein
LTGAEIDALIKRVPSLFNSSPWLRTPRAALRNPFASHDEVKVTLVQSRRMHADEDDLVKGVVWKGDHGVDRQERSTQ